VVQRLPVRIKLDPDQRDFVRLRPGMSVEAKVYLDPKDRKDPKTNSARTF
jgi:multidrug resistance efflux pump